MTGTHMTGAAGGNPGRPTDDFDAWITAWRAETDPALTGEQQAVINALADFAQRHRAYPVTESITIWGVSGISSAARPVEGGGWWVHLHDLIKPTGLTYAQLADAFAQAAENGQDGVAVICGTGPGTGGHRDLPVVRRDVVMRDLARLSPLHHALFARTAVTFAARLVHGHDDHPGQDLLDYGPDEQAEHAAGALRRIHAVAPLTPVTGTTIDLAGFGQADVHFETAQDRYLLLSEVADALGWPRHQAHAWAGLQHGYAIRDQRRVDEERGDGLLGWECLTGYIDLDLNLIADDPQATPDAGGYRWSHSGDWLVSDDRLPALLMSSPWSKEFMDNSLPAFGHAMREIWGGKLKGIPTYGADGQPTGGNAYDDLFATGGLPKDEALRRARRGPALDPDEQDGDRL